MKSRFFIFLGVVFFSNSVQASECLREGFVAAHNATQDIIEAFKAKETKPIADLMIEYIARGPSQKYMKNSTFDDVFSNKSRKYIISLEGTDSQCERVGLKGFMMGKGSIWLRYVPETHTGIVPIISFNHTKKVEPSTVEATHDYWQSGAGPLHPNCFSSLWLSADNYKTIADHYGIDGWRALSESPGKFFGSKITDFNMIKTGWDNPHKIHIGFKTSQCIANQLETKIDTYYGVKAEEYKDTVTGRCGDNDYCSFNSYKLLYVVPKEFCNKLAENFNGECKSSYLVERNSGEVGRSYFNDTSWSIYGVFYSIEHGEVIFPLKRFKTSDQANEFLQ